MKNLKLGVFGLNRGSDNFESIIYNDVEIVAVCDKDERLLNRAKDKLGDVALYTDFDSFINHGFDAVYLANYFPEHAPYAIKALNRNIHVISECTAAGTLAECVALVRAAEKSKAIYMLGENYPYMVFNQEMQKVYQGGTLGKVLFAEGEYNHTGDPKDLRGVARYYDSENHWRNFLPATYYLTHSLGPLMMATHSNPIRVTAMPIYGPKSENFTTASYIADNAAIIPDAPPPILPLVTPVSMVGEPPPRTEFWITNAIRMSAVANTVLVPSPGAATSRIVLPWSSPGCAASK